LFYLDGRDLLTSVSVQTTATGFSAGPPVKVLDRAYYAGTTARGYDLRSYDLSADGQRFLMIKDDSTDAASKPAPASMVVVLNWLEELKAKLPAK
jgi:hypothetical protein